MKNAENRPSASASLIESSADSGKVSSSLILAHRPTWISSGNKQEDDLNLFTTGSFYDCTFKVSNDATNESKVNMNCN
jgi:hypothetical protein